MNLLGKDPVLAEQLIVQILQYEMCLEPDQIWIRDQNRDIPPDERLYVVVGMVDSVSLSNVNSITPTVSPDGMVETFQVQTVDKIQIDIFSRTTEAIFRRWEVLGALSSLYAQQLQDSNFFKLFDITRSFTNTSETEGGSRLNKFSMIISALVWYYMQKVLSSPLGDYYNDFETRVDDENTIGTAHGIIDFNISES